MVQQKGVVDSCRVQLQQLYTTPVLCIATVVYSCSRPPPRGDGCVQLQQASASRVLPGLMGVEPAGLFSSRVVSGG